MRLVVPAESHASDETDSFDYFGADVRVHPEFGELTVFDWAEDVGALDSEDPRAAAAVKSLMRRVVHPADFEVFWALALQHRQTNDELAKLMSAIVEALTGRPTQRPSDSPAGRPSTVPNSVAAASMRAQQRLEAEGRPDLAVAVLRAREARTG